MKLGEAEDITELLTWPSNESTYNIFFKFPSLLVKRVAPKADTSNVKDRLTIQNPAIKSLLVRYPDGI